MDMQIDRPSRWLQWAQRTFGDIALDPRERTFRFIEEAIELAQAMGLSPADLTNVMVRVYEKPAGNRNREFGQCLATFETLARAVGVDADAEATAELARVQSVPQEEWDRRHGAKIKLGIAG